MRRITPTLGAISRMARVMHAYCILLGTYPTPNPKASDIGMEYQTPWHLKNLSMMKSYPLTCTISCRPKRFSIRSSHADFLITFVNNSGKLLNTADPAKNHYDSRERFLTGKTNIFDMKMVYTGKTCIGLPTLDYNIYSDVCVPLIDRSLR